jgi:hypothetical protein
MPYQIVDDDKDQLLSRQFKSYMSELNCVLEPKLGSMDLRKTWWELKGVLAESTITVRLEIKANPKCHRKALERFEALHHIREHPRSTAIQAASKFASWANQVLNPPDGQVFFPHSSTRNLEAQLSSCLWDKMPALLEERGLDRRYTGMTIKPRLSGSEAKVHFCLPLPPEKGGNFETSINLGVRNGNGTPCEVSHISSWMVEEIKDLFASELDKHLKQKPESKGANKLSSHELFEHKFLCKLNIGLSAAGVGIKDRKWDTKWNWDADHFEFGMVFPVPWRKPGDNYEMACVISIHYEIEKEPLASAFRMADALLQSFNKDKAEHEKEQKGEDKQDLIGALDSWKGREREKERVKHELRPLIWDKVHPALKKAGLDPTYVTMWIRVFLGARQVVVALRAKGLFETEATAHVRHDVPLPWCTSVLDDLTGQVARRVAGELEQRKLCFPRKALEKAAVKENPLVKGVLDLRGNKPFDIILPDGVRLEGAFAHSYETKTPPAQILEVGGFKMPGRAEMPEVIIKVIPMSVIIPAGTQVDVGASTDKIYAEYLEDMKDKVHASMQVPNEFLRKGPGPETPLLVATDLSWGKKAAQTLPRSKAAPLCPRCENGFGIGWPSDKICFRCGYPGWAKVHNGCRHTDLRVIFNGANRGKLQCLAEGCNAMFTLPARGKQIPDLFKTWQALEKQGGTVARIIRAPDDLRESAQNRMAPSGQALLKTKRETDFVAVAVKQDKSYRTIQVILILEPANEDAQAPLGGWGFLV